MEEGKEEVYSSSHVHPGGGAEKTAEAPFPFVLRQEMQFHLHSAHTKYAFLLVECTNNLI